MSSPEFSDDVPGFNAGNIRPPQAEKDGGQEVIVPGFSEEDIRKAGAALFDMMHADPRYRDLMPVHPHDDVAQRAGEIAAVHSDVLSDAVTEWAEEPVDLEYAQALFESAYREVNEELLPSAIELASTVRGEEIIGWMPDGLMDLDEEQLTKLRSYVAKFASNPSEPLDIEDITDDKQLQSDILRQLDALRLDMGYQAFDKYVTGALSGDEDTLADRSGEKELVGREELAVFVDGIAKSASKEKVGDAMNAAFDFKRLEALEVIMDGYSPEEYQKIAALINSASSEDARNALTVVAQALADERGIDLASSAHEA